MTKPNNVPSRQAAKERRQREAAERQAVYDNLPQAEKDKRNPRKAKV